MTTLEDVIARWNSNEGKPFKGRLIDWAAYGGDGKEPPANIGCMCAQGQVLHLLGGWTPRQLNSYSQSLADKETAKLLNISVAHAVLLRCVNDTMDGAPAIVLTHPEKIIGDQCAAVLAFWSRLDTMPLKDWHASWIAIEETAKSAAWTAAWTAAAMAAEIAVREVVKDAAMSVAGGWLGRGWASAGATMEIQGAAILRKRGHPFFFLPLFGVADPADLLKS